MTRETISGEELQEIEELDVERETLPKSIRITEGTPAQERAIRVLGLLAGEAPRLVREIRSLRAEAVRLEIQVQELTKAWAASDADRDRYGAMIDQALISLAGSGIATPEKGFRSQLVVALARHIDELAEQRDQARRELVRMTKAARANTPATAPEPVLVAASKSVQIYPVEDHENPEPLV